MLTPMTRKLHNQIRDYYGCTIYPMGQNSWGGRWETYVNGSWFRADTLAGIKATIRRVIGK